MPRLRWSWRSSAIVPWVASAAVLWSCRESPAPAPVESAASDAVEVVQPRVVPDIAAPDTAAPIPAKVVIVTRTAGYRHDSIEVGVDALIAVGAPLKVDRQQVLPPTHPSATIVA